MKWPRTQPPERSEQVAGAGQLSSRPRHRPSWRRRPPRAAWLALLGAAALATGVLAQSSPRLLRSVVGGGGGQSSSAAVNVRSTIGQPAVDVSSGGNVRLSGGFWWPLSVATATPTGPASLTPGGPPSATPTGPASLTPGGPPSATPTAPASVTPPPARQWVVNTTRDNDDQVCDAVHCSLREAINAANRSRAADAILFDIPPADPGCDASGPCTIRPSTALPELNDDSTLIDGYSQPGAQPNSAPFGQPINAVLKIVLDGSALPSCCPDGLLLTSDGNVVRGLVIQHFHNGITLRDANDNRVEGSFIGTDARGRAAAANRCDGVSVGGGEGSPGSARNAIGGSEPAARNLVAASGCAGIAIGHTGQNRVQGNYVGTDATGAGGLANNRSGVYIYNVSQGSLVGGTGPEEPNLIAFNGLAGVEINAGAGSARHNALTRNRIHGNADQGILLVSGGNDDLAAPTVTSATTTQASGTACANCVVEVFSDAEDEGAVFEGSVTADGSGRWALNRPGGLAGPFITSTATDGSGNTSAFSLPLALAGPGPSPSPTTGPSPTPGPSPTAGPQWQIFLALAVQRSTIGAP